MTRPRFSLVDYAGAVSRLPLDKALRLATDPRWAWQPKRDGSYCEFSTDATGRISRMVFRTGTQLDRDEHDGLLGLSVGLPLSTLVGELEVYSEAAVRTVAARGVRHLHVFDITRHVGRYVARLPFLERQVLISQWQSAVAAGETNGRWYEDGTGRAHDTVTHGFVQNARKNLARLPLVPYVTGRAALEDLWHREVSVGGGEGLVACNLDAPIGARGAKKKIKRHDSIDCLVVEIGITGVRVLWAGETFRIPCKRWVSQLAVGDVVEVKSDGFHEYRTIPKFARIVRKRTDLRGMVGA